MERSAIDWATVDEEIVAHLQNLLRIDTRNPPGHETRAAAYLQGVLAREGIAAEILGPTPDRGSLVARLRGDGSERPLLLMSHTDVVAVEQEQWQEDPFGGMIVDGVIHGRGALDMKHMVAMELQTMLLLKRSGVALKRDVIFMAAADEETGGVHGAGWLAHHHRDLIDAEYALNEGGGAGMALNGRLYYPIQTAEKGPARFRLRTHGRPGHGAQPHDDQAILKLAALLDRLGKQRLPVHLTQTVRRCLQTLAATQPAPVAAQVEALLGADDPDAIIDGLPFPAGFRRELHAVIRNTVSPTVLNAGSQMNVIPSAAEALVDARILPGWTLDMVRAELQTVFQEEVDLEFILPSTPLENDPQSPLFETIVQVLAERDPDGTAIPTLFPAGTDAKHIAPLGVKVYGFAPGLHPTDWSGMHGHNEQIQVASLQWGARTLFEVVARFAGHEK
ncbi:MAG: M20/M25/M40 family metallo-hydrolase [Herpetosiphon sp.]